MKVFYLIRHGQKRENILNPELTELGHTQAQKTGVYLRQFPISKIIASPALRTQQTARHITDALTVPFSTDARLKERIHWEETNNAPREVFEAEWGKTSIDRDLIPQWGDSSREKGRKMEQVMHELEGSADENIALISHGGAILDFLRNVFDEKLLTSVKLQDKNDFHLHECSITQVILDKQKFVLQKLHFTDHLA
jgi:broad specificity phosphatase PhoE